MNHPCVCTIVPPHILDALAKHADAAIRTRALNNIQIAAAFREQRSRAPMAAAAPAVTAAVMHREVYDSHHNSNTSQLPGTLVRTEGGAATPDAAVNHAYDGSGDTYHFYKTVLNRNSVDNQGMRLRSSVHFAQNYDNAFWNGSQMVYGDGDGQIFVNFTNCLDVIGHELTHGVTQHSVAGGLTYQGQSGALNESISDVFGSLVKQYKLGQTVQTADWLIGKGLLGPTIHGQALRSMKAPGTAYNDPNLGGKDPQPADMPHYVNTAADNGGVHINSGIPNHAFYIAAVSIGGKAWERTGKIWYHALTTQVHSNTDFKGMAHATIAAATTLHGATSAEKRAVEAAWHKVQVLP